MHRLGFMPKETAELITILKASKIAVSTVFTHLAGADEEELSDYSNLQIEKFNQFCSSLRSAGISGFKRHILNSAGILRFPESAFEMVRLGIGLYGIEANRLLQDELRPVSRLKTIVSQVKNLKAGDSVGYGRKAVLEQDGTIATIAIGYSDGFRRDFSQGKAVVTWNGIQMPVLGNVCMDMCMVDVSGLEVCEGDEITIFEDAESIHKLAKAADTIPYEILTGIGHRVKRIFYRE
jgi:alanine racemase